MANISKGSDLYIKVPPNSKQPVTKLNRKDGHLGLSGQLTSETSSATTSVSGQGSSQATTSFTATSSSSHHVRRYTITASEKASPGPGPDNRPIPVNSVHKTRTVGLTPSVPSVVISKRQPSKEDDALGSPQVVIEPSEPQIPSEAWWNQQTGIDEPMKSLTVDSGRHSSNGVNSPGSPSKIPRRKHGYPPTSYRDPFSHFDDDSMYDDLPRLPADWKPPGYRPPQHPTEIVAKPSKHLRSGGLSGPASTDPKKPSLVPSSSGVRPAKHTRATTSHDTSPVSYQSPKVVAPIAIPSRSRSTSHTSSFGQRARGLEGAHLPPPEEVYSQVIYFTKCPHTSPPATRPIGTQPIFQPLSQELLEFPSHSIRAQLDLATRTGRQKQIYTIAGTCPECDWKARRNAESGVLVDFAQKRYQMEKRLAHLEMQEGEDEPDSPPTPEQPAWEPSEKRMDLQLSILTLETDIEELEARQDHEVKKVWKGFASKWGPGAVGIQKEEGSEQSRSRTGSGTGSRTESRATVGTSGTASSVDNVHADGRMKLDWIRPDRKK